MTLSDLSIRNPVFAWMLMASTILFGIVAAIRAVGWIHGQLRARIPDEARLGLPPIQAPGLLKSELAAPLLLPVMFVVVWIYVLAAGPR